MTKLKIIFPIFCALISLNLFSDSLSDKKQLLSQKNLSEVETQYQKLNLEIDLLKAQLKKLYNQSQLLAFNSHSEGNSVKEVLVQCQKIKEQIKVKEEAFKKLSQNESFSSDSYALMQESEITLEQFIIEYGSSNYLYVIPPEMAKIQLSLCSNMPIPKTSWEEIVELICHQNGIGIKPLNSFVKSLFWNLNNSSQSLKHITANSEELDLIEPANRVCYVLHLNGSEFQKVHLFLKKFINERYTSLHAIGNDLLIIGEAKEVKELTKLLTFIKKNEQQKSYKLLPLRKIPSEHLQAILIASFQESKKSQDLIPISIIALKEHLVVFGSPEDLERAEKLALDISSQIACPNDMTLYWYECKYSDPQDLAMLLQQVYDVVSCQLPQETVETAPVEAKPKGLDCVFRPGTIPPICEKPSLVVDPKPVEAYSNSNDKAKGSYPNFIIDGKSGNVIFVVKLGLLERLKELTKRIDIPKKMVQIEILLFEKKVTDQTQFGLNLLQLGSSAKNLTNQSSFDWTVDKSNRSSPGIMNYFLTRKRPGGSFPPINFAYNFLISQEDVFIHSNPTITTINQTQAVIDLVEEQSINMGTVEDPRTSVITNTFVRAQYGIIIEITPTINQSDSCEDFNDYITLDTNIIFDTTTSDKNNRPDVARRHIQNQVRIADGETLILGGLRRKNEESNVDKIPFLGDIPGVGKLFSFTTLNDKSTEMFIFITPRIISDPKDASVESKKVDLDKRPGDSPELLKKLMEAKLIDKEVKYKSTFSKLFAS